MAEITNGVITNQGINLRSKTDAGVTLELKRLVMGDGVPAEGTDLKAITTLVNELKAFDIQSKLPLGSGVTRIRTILSNAGMTTGFHAREVGVIANDPNDGEILYAYGTADPADWIPPETEAFQQVFDSNLITGNTQDITVTLAPDAATMTLMDMQDHEAKQLDPTDTDPVKENHLSNAQGKAWQDHLANRENPHEVTKSEVGLGSLPNAKSDSVTLNNSEVLSTAKAAKIINDALVAHAGNAIAHAPFAAGTSMLFNQSSAPVGWTKKSDWADNASLIIGNTYGSGGSDSPVNWATNIGVDDHALHGHTITVDNHILAITEIPSHSHEIKNSSNAGSNVDVLVYGERGDSSFQPSTYTRVTGGGAGHNHTASANNSGPTTHSITQDTYTPKYQIVISATKD